VEFRILGPLRVVDAGREVSVPGPKVRALLALLLVRAGAVVPAERLADELWGEALPADAANALQSLVSKLRRSLGETGRSLVTEFNGYRFDVAPDSIDAVRFAEQAELGHQALLAGDPAGAADALGSALALWNGAALDGLSDEGALHREAIRLEELRSSTLEHRIDADLRLGRHVETIGELVALTAAHPLRERIHGFLMLALYRSGRQSEALRAFQDARAVLADEAGLDPGPGLRALESSILAHDPQLVVGLAAPLRPVPSHRTNVTRRLSSFIGRVDEVAALTDVVGRNRLVTVVGPGGAGKTRLATEVAAGSLPSRDVWFVDLAPLQSPDGVAATVAASVGVADGALAMDPQATARSSVERTAEQLGAHETLLLLDNCEHVVHEAARVAEQLLMACPGLTILATSREALGVPGETTWPAPPMSVEDAVALFADRAAATSGFAMSGENTRTVNDLCERLDGMPLAIELAAGRVRAMPVHQLASRLDDRFRLLTGGARTALPRQQTLRAVVEWSYDLLFDDEQRIFDRLSVFAGGCSLEAAEAVCGGNDIAGEDVADLLAHLVDKSLVIADHSGREVRYRMLQTLGLYGREQLDASNDAQRVRSRHATYFADLCHRGHAALRGHDQERWLREVEREADNLRACLAWTIDRGDALRAQTMLGGLGWSWWFAGRSSEGWRFLTACLSCPGETTPIARASAAMWAAYVGACNGAGLDDSRQLAVEAVGLLKAHPGQYIHDVTTESLLSSALTILANIDVMMARTTEARESYAAAHVLYAAGTDGWNRAFTANSAGWMAEIDGNVALAFEQLSLAVKFFESAGVVWASAIINGDCAMLAIRLGKHRESFELMERARQASRDLRLGGYEAILLSRLGAFALAAGEVTRADELTTEALELAETGRFFTAQAFALLGLAVVRRVQQRPEDAITYARRSAELFDTTGPLYPRSQSLSTIGFVAQGRGDIDTARAMHTEAFSIARATQHLRNMALATEGLAGVALLEGDGVRAATLLGAARAVRVTDGGAAAGPESDVHRIRMAAVDLIGEDAFIAAAISGAASKLDELLPA
jgi:predicted ATPase/DNA-binding SARP family transcriptional activator